MPGQTAPGGADAAPAPFPHAAPPNHDAAADEAEPVTEAWSPSAAAEGGAASPAPGPHKRRRRRRRGPRPANENQAANAAPGEAASGDGVAPAEGVAQGEAVPGTPPQNRPPRPRHRARRRFHREPQAQEGAPANGGEGGEGQAPRFGRRRRERDIRQERQADDAQRREARDRDRGNDRDRGDRDRGHGHDRERNRDGKRDRDRDRRPGKKGFHGKGREGARRRDEPRKLYHVESVIDRGFEEMTAPPPEGVEGAEATTRRVDWTIVKRTVADQKSAKVVSAAYILRRDGSDTEFPNLSAARAAVNKVIVHPEKLTRAKSEYVSGKK